jgi:predicted transcriptional regulator
MTTQLAIRLSDEQLGEIDRLVPGVHETRSALIRRAIEMYLYRLACERDAMIYESLPLSDDELSAAHDSRNWDVAPKW